MSLMDGGLHWSGIVVFIAVAVGWAAWLVWWDITQRRLPNCLTLPAGIIAICAAIYWGPHQAWWGLLWPGMYVLLRIANSGVGGGDIKLAIPLGIAVAWGEGFIAVVVAMLLASVFTVAWCYIVIASRQGTAGAGVSVPHGPSMLLASGIGIMPAII